MLDNAEKLIKEHAYGGKKIAVAVSGGSDSMCLLSFILSLDFIDINNVTVFNVEHGIRGEKSRADSRFVEAFCAEKGVAFKGFSADVPALCAVSGRSIESEAREIRQTVYNGLVQDGVAELVLTAHHMLDNVETVLYRLFRGSGISGLGGMEILSRGYLLKPFLNTPKQEIDAYVKRNNVPFVTDESNADISYTRNYIRHRILPVIAERFPGIESAVSGIAEDAKTTARRLKSELDETLIEPEKDGAVSIYISAINGDSVLAPYYVSEALERLGERRDIGRKHIDYIMSLANMANGSSIDLKKNLTAVKEYDRITFIKRENASCGREFCAELREGGFSAGGYELTIESVNFDEARELIESAKRRNNGEPGNRVLVADADKLSGAVLRFRTDGDRFRPYRGGTKKLKDYLIDKKLTRRARDSLIVAAKDGEVLFIAGVEVSESAAVTNETQRFYKITYKRTKEDL